MNLKRLVNRQTISKLSRFTGGGSLPPCLCSIHRYFSVSTTINASIRPSISICPPGVDNNDSARVPNLKYSKPPFLSLTRRFIHSAQQTGQNASSFSLKHDLDDPDEDGMMNEFLSRFVWIMRGKISEAYPDADKHTIDGMLLIIVEKVVSEMEKGSLEQMLSAGLVTRSQDFSEDLWRTVWEVSNSVVEDMDKERKKEKMKGALHSEEVKEMCRFAADIGIRGDLLRELKFKWAREKVEENEFYESFEQLRKEERAHEKGEAEGKITGTIAEEAVMDGEKTKVVSLPKRHGKIKYKIYGLDLSDPKWAEVADKIHETGEIMWPQEPKTISGKCKPLTEKILSLKEEDDPSPLLAEWVELLQPRRIDWIALLDKLKEQNTNVYLKVAELLLDEKSFQPTTRDYSLLIDTHAKWSRLEDAERILKKMNQSGILPDIITATVLIHMYSKAGNIDRAREAFESLRSHGFQPDMKVYTSMIMAYVNAGEPKFGESLMREMETRDIKPTEEIYMALLRSFAQRGDVGGAGRIATTMQFAGFQPSLESCTLLVEAYGQAGDPDQARSNFDYMMNVGQRPDDRCVASMIAAYEKKNLLDKALNLLLQLEKDGFVPGPATNFVLLNWLSKLLLVEEAEELLEKIAQQGEAPSVKIQVSLCDMYARAGIEKKTLQTLGILEAKKDQLGAADFERIIDGLVEGGFVRDADRVRRLMEAQGFAASYDQKISIIGTQLFKPIAR